MEVVELRLRDSVGCVTSSFPSSSLRLLGGRRYQRQRCPPRRVHGGSEDRWSSYSEGRLQGRCDMLRGRETEKESKRASERARERDLLNE